jgi:hypothetical protein
MNSKVNQSNKVCIGSKRKNKLGLLSICPSLSSPGPYIGGQVSRIGRGPTQITISTYMQERPTAQILDYLF